MTITIYDELEEAFALGKFCESQRVELVEMAKHNPSTLRSLIARTEAAQLSVDDIKVARQAGIDLAAMLETKRKAIREGRQPLIRP